VASRSGCLLPHLVAFLVIYINFEAGGRRHLSLILARVDTSREPGRLAIRTLRFKVHPDAYAWLNQAAVEVNQVWNFVNATSFKAIRPYAGQPRWLSGFDLCRLTAGATDYFEHIGADTIQRVCVEYARKRRAAKLIRLRWRKSQGARRSLGWVPFKAASLRRHGRYLHFCGNAIRFGRKLSWTLDGGCSRHSCCTKASTPAAASKSSVSETPAALVRRVGP
jgi:hypothetical protein